MPIKLRARKCRKNYVTYEVTLPKKVIDALGWREGLQLKVMIIEYNSVPGILLLPERKDKQ